MAPFTPFLTDYVWQRAAPCRGAGVGAPGVWPAADAALIDAELSAQMALVRRLVELGRAARAGATVKTRQPLARARWSAAPGFDALPDELRRRSPTSSTWRRFEPLDGELVDYRRQAELPGARQAVRVRAPSWSPRPSATPADAGRTARLPSRSTASSSSCRRTS